jgi:hypothetical protein
LAVSVSKINVDLSIADIYAALLIGKAMPVAKVKPQKPKTSGAAKKKQNFEISLCLEVTLNLTSEFGQYSEFSAAKLPLKLTKSKNGLRVSVSKLHFGGE